VTGVVESRRGDKGTQQGNRYTHEVKTVPQRQLCEGMYTLQAFAASAWISGTCLGLTIDLMPARADANWCALALRVLSIGAGDFTSLGQHT